MIRFFNNLSFQFRAGAFGGFITNFRTGIFSLVRIIGFLCIAFVVSGFGIESIRIFAEWDHSEVIFPFWFYFILFSSSYAFSIWLVSCLSRFGLYNIVFHCFFILLGLNISNVIVQTLGVYVHPWSYVFVASSYAFLVLLGNSRITKFCLVACLIYSFFIFLNDSETFLLFFNAVVYKASRRRRRLKRKFYHTFVPSVFPAKKLIILFYKQFGDTVFVWDYGTFVSSCIYVVVSCLVFLALGSLYFKFIQIISQVGWVKQFLILFVSGCFAGGVIYFSWSFFLFLNLPYLPTAFIEFFDVLGRLGHQFDYQSYILFVCYASALYIVFRSWILVLRRVIFEIVGREYVIDLDYKTIRPIVYGSSKFPLFWKFPRFWFKKIFDKPKPFRRSTAPEAPEDAVYYYGGPNPNMVVFNPYNGSVTRLFVRDLIHENYRVYYKLRKFAKQKVSIALFPVYEKRWLLSWVLEERRKFRIRNFRAFGPYYFYTRYDLHSDYLVNRLLVYEDVGKDHSEGSDALEEAEKDFFDTHLWESVWVKGFGRLMPSPIPARLVLRNFLNPSLEVLPEPSYFVDDYRERYQDMVMFRRRYLFKQESNIHQAIGFFPNEMYFFMNRFQSNLDKSELINFAFKNLVFVNLHDCDGRAGLNFGFKVKGYLAGLIRGLQDLYFREMHQFGFHRIRSRRLLWFINRNFPNPEPKLKRRIGVYLIVSQFIHQILAGGLHAAYLTSLKFKFYFYKYYKVRRLEDGILIFQSNFRSQFIHSSLTQLRSFGFCGFDLRRDNDNSLSSLVNVFKSDFFSLPNTFRDNFAYVLSNLPEYTELIKPHPEFFGIFERLDPYTPGLEQGQSGRFCFVNSRIILKNDRESRLIRFYVNLNTWSDQFGKFDFGCYDLFKPFTRFLHAQHFIIGDLFYSKYVSDSFVITNCLGSSILGGLESSSLKFCYLGLSNPGSDPFQEYVNPKFLTKLERIYRNLPFDGFSYSVFCNSGYGFTKSRSITQNFSVSGLELPFLYTFSTIDSFYLNSFIFQLIQSQLFEAFYRPGAFSRFMFRKLYSARFRVPTFYPIFDQNFSNSLLKFVDLNSGIMNNLKFNYLVSCTFREFHITSSEYFNIKSFSVYRNNYCEGTRSFIPRYYWFSAFSKNFNKYFLLFTFNSKYYSLTGRCKTFGDSRVYIRSHRWIHNWSIKFVWSTGPISRFEYYSAKEHSRFAGSFVDRAEIYSLSNVVWLPNPYSHSFRGCLFGFFPFSDWFLRLLTIMYLKSLCVSLSGLLVSRSIKYSDSYRVKWWVFFEVWGFVV